MTPLPTKAFIDGHWTSKSAATFSVRNPATGELLATIADCDAADTISAISAAGRAFQSWKRWSFEERGKLLRKISEGIRLNQDRLAEVMTREQGKPLEEARRELAYGASYFDWYAEKSLEPKRESQSHPDAKKNIRIEREPIGVVAAITPWNFPHAMFARKLAAALAAGCTFIEKPAEETPLSALLLAECCASAGLPPGVCNVLPTSDPVAVTTELMRSSVVRKISFTGSTEVGKLLYRQSADTVKRLTLELGGNAPFIICADADLSRALDGLLSAKFRNAGQTCIAVNRVLVHRSVYKPLVEKLIDAVKNLKVGNGLTPGVQIGPLINDEAVQKVRELVQDATARGAEKLYQGEGAPKGHFVAPVILSATTPEMRIWHEEIFGPVLALSIFDEDSQAINLANDTPYGLASYIYSSDTSRATRYSEELAFGMVGVNESAISLASAPFGGIKESGFGREGGQLGLEEYLNVKYVLVGAA
jgi:succinate-semialdehyde dehydrogenase/glutarate-semialdehyde dehydrogenase